MASSSFTDWPRHRASLMWKVGGRGSCPCRGCPCAGHPGRGGRQLTLTPTPSRYLPFLWVRLLGGQQLPGQGQVPPLLGHALDRLEGMIRDARWGVCEGRGIEVLEGETLTVVSPWWRQIGRELRPSLGPGDPQVMPRRTLSGSQFLLRQRAPWRCRQTCLVGMPGPSRLSARPVP